MGREKDGRIIGVVSTMIEINMLITLDTLIEIVLVIMVVEMIGKRDREWKGESLCEKERNEHKKKRIC